jgi:hypothetical protein
MIESTNLRAIRPHLPHLTETEMLDLATELIQRAKAIHSPKPPVDWERFKGVISDGPDPLEYQRQIREEWE